MGLPNLTRSLFACLLLALLTAPGAHALELEADRSYRDFHGEILYQLNALPSTTPPGELRQRVERDFRPLSGEQIDFGFTRDTVWLFLPIESRSGQPGEWLLSLNTRFMNELVVYQYSGGSWVELLRNDERSGYAERPLDYRLLAVEFSLDAGARGELLIGYRSSGTTYLPVTIESRQSFADARRLADSRSAGFYTAVALMLVYGLFQWLLLGSRIHFHYSLYLGAAVLYISHMDGLSFQYLWPELPRWNAFASLPLGLAINIAAANFARHFLRTWETAPGFDRAIRLMIALSLAALAWGLLVEDLQVKRAGFWLSSVGALIYLAAGIRALFAGERFARFYVAGWIGICIAAIVSSVIHSLPGVLPVALSFDVTKAGILFDALMFGMAIADQAAETRRQRDAAQAREMAAVAERARARNALQAAQAGRADALQLAREKGLQLASASHDIRQPLASLKVALSRVQEQSDDARAALDSIAYLDALVGGYLDSAREEFASAPAGGEAFPIQLVLDAVQRMFAAEAQSRGLALRCRASSLRVVGNPVATVRVVGNLVKNAIQHSTEGSVLLGCRRDSGRCGVCVVDSGSGVDEVSPQDLLEPFQQGTEPAAESHGLGLHIVSSLCRREGYEFSLDRRPRRGSIARVWLPLAPKAECG